MSFNKIKELSHKTGILSAFIISFAVVSLVATPAMAVQFRLGDVNVQLDNTVSFGVSLRMADREEALLPARNGGIKDESPGVDLIAAGAGIPEAMRDCGTASELFAYATSIGTHCMFDNTALGSIVAEEKYNYDGSINTDDGRLNFDNGDPIGGTFKILTELEAQMGDVTFFTRFNAFYDAVLGDDNSFERSAPLDTAEQAQVYDIDVLDLYVDWLGEIGNLPFTLRAGRQVINWGEATFILGGNSVFNPISVPAFRRPGSEIKEALLPVNAIYGSISLPGDLTLEAYVGGWDNYVIDPGGSPFANSDSFELGSSANGNRTYVGSGAYSGSNRRNCLAASNPNDVTALFGDIFNKIYGECAATDSVHFLYDADGDGSGPNAAGFVEESRQSYVNVAIAGTKVGGSIGDTDFLSRTSTPDDEPDSSDNYGISLRWYAENLNSTEFALYYQKYASRIPYASTIAYNPQVGPNVTNPNASSTLRGATAQGCVGTYAASGGFISNADTLGVFANDVTGVGAELLTRLADPATAGAIAGNAAANYLLAVGATGDDTHLTQAEINSLLVGSPVGTALVKIGAQTALFGNQITAALGMESDANGNASLASGAITGCLGVLAQATAGQLMPTGASTIATRYQIGVLAEYPEDIEVIGLSFNTTAFGWGVQGEIAYRDNMPLQLDTDSVSIAAIAASCAWENFSAVANVYYGLQTIESTCGDFDQIFSGYVREEVYNVDIGTTATFTRSNRVVNFLGADLGVFLTELGYVSVPGAEDYIVPNMDAAPFLGAEERTPRLANQCTSGSDLPLGGVFGLDPRGPLTEVNTLDPTKPTEMCRPTKDSYGLVLFGYLQYNNVFGSAIGLRPTFAYQRGLEGRSPSPAGSFIEENESLSISVSAEYQAKWTASLGYTMYNGDALYNRNIDRDYLSASVSYAF